MPAGPGEWRRFEVVGFSPLEAPHDLTSLAALEKMADVVAEALGFSVIDSMQVLSLASVPTDMATVSGLLCDAILAKAKDHGLGMPWWSMHIRQHLAQAWLDVFEPLGQGLWRLRQTPLASPSNPS